MFDSIRKPAFQSLIPTVTDTEEKSHQTIIINIRMGAETLKNRGIGVASFLKCAGSQVGVAVLDLKAKTGGIPRSLWANDLPVEARPATPSRLQATDSALAVPRGLCALLSL